MRFAMYRSGTSTQPSPQRFLEVLEALLRLPAERRFVSGFYAELA
jgi:hypothetical protein